MRHRDAHHICAIALFSYLRFCSSLRTYHRDIDGRTTVSSLQSPAFINLANSSYIFPARQCRRGSLLPRLCQYNKPEQQLSFAKLHKTKATGCIVPRSSSYSLFSQGSIAPKIAGAIATLLILLWFLFPKPVLALDISSSSIQQILFDASLPFRRVSNLLPAGTPRLDSPRTKLC